MLALENVIYLGGLFNFSIAIFHMFFWRIFDWNRDLRSIRFVNRAVMQIMNLSLIVIFFLFAFISFSYPVDLLITRLGHAIILSISVFWFLRAFMQAVFFGFKNKISVMFFILFLIGGMIYIYPLVY